MSEPVDPGLRRDMSIPDCGEDTAFEERIKDCVEECLNDPVVVREAFLNADGGMYGVVVEQYDKMYRVKADVDKALIEFMALLYDKQRYWSVTQELIGYLKWHCEQGDD